MLDYPVTPNNKVDITNLTHATIDGNGVFDVLMRTVNAHLQKEWAANRLKGTEYSTVYLGALESTMNTSLQFLLAKDKLNAELDILKQQLVNLKVEEANAIKQGLQLVAQTAQTTQQTSNLLLEAGNIPKQGAVLTNQASLITKQELQVVAETLNVPKQGQLIDANRLQTEAQTTIANTQSTQDLLVKQAQVVSMGKDDEIKVKQALQITAETLNVPKQGLLIDAQKETQLQQKINLADELFTAAQQRTNLASENQAIIAKTTNTAQQTANLLAESANIPKQGAVYDSTNLKVAAEKALLTDKLTTEASQRTVLSAQASGYSRDAEQKAAEIMTRAFAAIATTTNMNSAAASGYGISESNVAAAVSKLISNS